MSNTLYHTIVLTTEHASTGKMGGIGSYNAETGQLSSGTLFLLVDDSIEQSPAESVVLCKQYVAKYLPEYNETYQDFTRRNYVILEVIRHLINKYPSVSQVALHEYAGLGARVAEAAKTGSFPANVRVRIHCHGGHVQLERATGQWLGTYLDVLNDERSSIENSDEVWFAGHYLYELYRASGIRMQDNRLKFLGLPYQLSSVSGKTKTEFTDVTNLAFIGRMNKLKGYDIFCDIVEEILHEGSPYKSQIKTITAIGNDDNSMSDMREHIKKVSQSAGVTYFQTLKTRNETLEYVRNHARDTIFILPYYSDNYSVAMLEIIDAGAPLLVLNTGGNAELMHDKLWTDKRIAKDANELKNLTQQYLALPNDARCAESARLRDAFIHEQDICNKKYAALFSPLVWSRPVEYPDYTPRIEHVYIDTPDGVERPGWHKLNGETGLHDGDLSEHATHVFLSHSDIQYETTELDAALLGAIRSAGAETILAVGSRSGNHINLVRNTSLGQFILNPEPNTPFNICLPIDIYEDILLRYRVRQCTNRSGSEFIFAAITYSLYAQGVRILPLPLLLGKSSSPLESSLVYDDMIFADFAHFQRQPSWEVYRYVAILRHNTTRDSSDPYKIIKDYEQLLTSTDKAGRLARKIIRYQLRLVSVAKKVRTSFFHR